MKKVRGKRIILVAAALLLVMAMLTACGGGGSNAVVGSWKADKIEVNGMSVSLSEAADTLGMTLEITFDFKDDGTVTGNAMGTTVDGTYKVNGSKVTVDINGETQDMTVNGSEMVMESPQGKITLIKQ